MKLSARKPVSVSPNVMDSPRFGLLRITRLGRRKEETSVSS